MATPDQESQPTLTLTRDEIAVIYKLMLLLNGWWGGDEARLFRKLRNWLRRQR